MIYNEDGPTHGEAQRDYLRNLAVELQPLRRINNGGAPLVQDLLIDLGNITVDLEARLEELDAELTEEESQRKPDERHVYSLNTEYFATNTILERLLALGQLETEHC